MIPEAVGARGTCANKAASSRPDSVSSKARGTEPGLIGTEKRTGKVMIVDGCIG